MDIKIERHVTDKKEKEMIQERKKTIRAKGTKKRTVHYIEDTGK